MILYCIWGCDLVCCCAHPVWLCPDGFMLSRMIIFFIMSCYKSGFFSEEDTSLKDDMKAIKNFLKFIKIDILKVLKKEKV